jgi:hypothetical protein
MKVPTERTPRAFPLGLYLVENINAELGVRDGPTLVESR